MKRIIAVFIFIVYLNCKSTTLYGQEKLFYRAIVVVVAVSCALVQTSIFSFEPTTPTPQNKRWRTYKTLAADFDSCKTIVNLRLELIVPTFFLKSTNQPTNSFFLFDLKKFLIQVLFFYIGTLQDEKIPPFQTIRYVFK